MSAWQIQMQPPCYCLKCEGSPHFLWEMLLLWLGQITTMLPWQFCPLPLTSTFFLSKQKSNICLFCQSGHICNHHFCFPFWNTFSTATSSSLPFSLIKILAVFPEAASLTFPGFMRVLWCKMQGQHSCRNRSVVCLPFQLHHPQEQA